MRAARVPSTTDHRLVIDELEVPQPIRGSVRVRVEACGICHSDWITVGSVWPITYPRAPGHEIAGTIDAVGDEVVGWSLGDRVGVGWHGGHCGQCDRCRRGDFLKCRFLRVPGQAYDGGYAQYVIVPVGALARIPAGLTAADAAPLMCAGVTTFNALRHSAARAGDLVAILGIGGLGHLGIQYAAKMGFNTVAIARGADKELLARQLGAHHYVDSLASDVAEALRDLGGARVVLSTVTSAKAIEPVLNGLGLYGELVVVGAAHDPLMLDTAAMIGGNNGLRAWASGTCVDSEDAMKFSVQAGIRPMIEMMPLERAQEAFDRMMSGAARFRMVLTHGV
jgi:D-arabinose 1-dehydrogenase-like Zn-dependent alcohol dehydrogenase